MSNTNSTGYYNKQADSAKKEKCPKSSDNQHKWEKFGSWPSVWHTCKHCKESIYSK